MSDRSCDSGECGCGDDGALAQEVYERSRRAGYYPPEGHALAKVYERPTSAEYNPPEGRSPNIQGVENTSLRPRSVWTVVPAQSFGQDVVPAQYSGQDGSGVTNAVRVRVNFECESVDLDVDFGSGTASVSADCVGGLSGILGLLCPFVSEGQAFAAISNLCADQAKVAEEAYNSAVALMNLLNGTNVPPTECTSSVTNFSRDGCNQFSGTCDIQCASVE